MGGGPIIIIRGKSTSLKIQLWGEWVTQIN